MDIKTIPDNFCWRPFTSLYVDKWGYSGPCCGYRSEQFNNNLPEQFSINDFNNFDLHKDIRDLIKDGKPLPLGCKTKCIDLENNGIKLTDRLTYSGPTDDKLVTDNKFSLKQLELAVDNVCNLACITCGSYHSSKWIAENKRMGTTDKNLDKIQYIDVDVFKEQFVWENVEKLILYGGEPFYSKSTVDLLNWLLENNLSKNIELSFFTNGTIIPHNIAEMSAKFKSINYSISIDGTHDRFEVLRWPAKWDVVDGNFKKLKELNFDNVFFTMTYTYSLCNASFVDKDFEYFNQNYLENQHIFRNLVTYPEEWMARHLPDALKEKLIKKYQNNYFLHHFIPELEADRNEEKYQEAIRKLKLLDSYRNVDHRILFDEY